MFRTALPRPFPCYSGLTASRPWLVARHPALHSPIRFASSGSNLPRTSNEGNKDADRSPQSQSVADSEAARWAQLKEQLREWSHHTATSVRQQIDQYTASLAVTFSQLGKEINRVTGYGEIEILKRKVVEQEARIEAVRQAAREAKAAYDRAVLQRASSQREVNDLLQRKSSWSDEDVVRFTSLVRQDHQHEQEESRAKEAAVQAEDAVEREFSELMRIILNRYHEEQAWSDKIRSASTYGSLAVMGVNMFVFVLAIVFVEPWKRRRLTQTFERKVEEMSAQNTAMLESKSTELADRLEEQDRMLSQLVETVHYSLQFPEADRTTLQSVDGEPQAGDVEPLPALKSNQELALALATSAAVAGIVGWLARSWYG